MVYSRLSAAVTDEVFCRGGYAFSLDSFDHDTAVGLDDRRVIRVTLVSTAPSIVLGLCKCGRKRPVDTGCSDFAGGGCGNFSD